MTGIDSPELNLLVGQEDEQIDKRPVMSLRPRRKAVHDVRQSYGAPRRNA
jgi:hypothetical protein